MRSEDGDEFKVYLGALAVTFDREVTDPVLTAYWIGLKDLELRSIKRAMGEAIRTCTRMPTPAEIRRLAGEATGDDAALQAWMAVSEAVAGKGPYRHVSFDDGVSNAAIRSMGGWPSFCLRFTDTEAEKWVRHEFLKAYLAFARGTRDGEAYAPLPGISKGAARGGQLIEPPVEIISTGLPVNDRALISARGAAPAMRIGSDQQNRVGRIMLRGIPDK